MAATLNNTARNYTTHTHTYNTYNCTVIYVKISEKFYNLHVTHY